MLFSVCQTRHFPSGRLTLQPDAENVQRRVDVAIVRRSAVRTLPAPYSKRAHAFRAAHGNGPASRARLGTVSLVGFDVPRLPSGSFVAQHVSEARPARIVHGLGKPCSTQAGGVHIADDDQRVIGSNPRRLLMKMVPARIGDLRRYGADTLAVLGALGRSERDFVLPEYPRCRNLLAVAERGKVFQPDVNPDCASAPLEVVSNFGHECDVPAPSGVLNERSDLEQALNVSGLPKAIAALPISHSAALKLNGALREGYPAKRPVAGAKARATAVSLPACHELANDRVHRVGMQVEQFARAGGQHRKIEVAGPACRSASSMAALRFLLGSDAEVPNLIARPRVTNERLARRRVLDPVLESKPGDGLRNHVSFLHLITQVGKP
jgi:hypothetical protein